MKVLAIISSANKEGSGAILTQELCSAFSKPDIEVEYVHLYDLAFKSCGNCEEHSDLEGFCSKRDDLVPVLQKLVEADLVVWSAPVYMDYISGTAKTFFDRFCIFVNPDFTINRISGKKFAFILTCGASEHEANQPVLTSVTEMLTDFFKCDVVGTMLATGQMNAKQNMTNELREQAQAIGKDILAKL